MKNQIDVERMPQTLNVYAVVEGDEYQSEIKYEAYDDDLFTKGVHDVRYEKVVCPVETALKLLTEAGYNVEIQISKST